MNYIISNLFYYFEKEELFFKMVEEIVKLKRVYFVNVVFSIFIWIFIFIVIVVIFRLIKKLTKSIIGLVYLIKI